MRRSGGCRAASVSGKAEGGSVPEWTTLELQGELKKWKKDTQASGSSSGLGDDGFDFDDGDRGEGEGDDGEGRRKRTKLSKDPAEVRLFASTFIPGLKDFALFKIDHPILNRAIVTYH